MKLPRSPFGKTCETCLFWHAPSRGKYYATDNGQFVPVSAVSLANLPQGTSLLGTGQIDMAPCAQGPAWFPAPADHWCWQHPTAQRVLNSMSRGTTLKTALADAKRGAMDVSFYPDVLRPKT